MKSSLRFVAFLALAGCLIAAAVSFFRLRPVEIVGDPYSPEILIPLSGLPGIAPKTLAAQGTLFRIQEPFLYNRETKMGIFAVEILSKENFEKETHLIIGGDAKSLECFRNEILFVNSGAAVAGPVIDGAKDGVVELATGLWQLVRHPVDSVGGLASGVKNAAVYAWDTKATDMKDDTARLAKAFYFNKASETAESHHLDYFDLKTEQGKDAIHSEVNAELSGRGATELALLLIPFSKVSYAGGAAKVAKAAEAADAVNVAGKMAKAGRIPAEAVEFAKAGRLFPKMVEKMTATLTRLKDACATTRYKPAVAKFGEAASLDYRSTFLAANKGVDAANVVVHHAVEQQAMRRYPGLITDAEMHSLENLRGIPKALDPTLHKAEIAREWNDFYRMNPAATMTKEKLLAKATEIDRKLGHLFTPKVQ